MGTLPILLKEYSGFLSLNEFPGVVQCKPLLAVVSSFLAVKLDEQAVHVDYTIGRFSSGKT